MKTRALYLLVCKSLPRGRTAHARALYPGSSVSDQASHNTPAPETEHSHGGGAAVGSTWCTLPRHRDKAACKLGRRRRWIPAPQPPVSRSQQRMRRRCRRRASADDVQHDGRQWRDALRRRRPWRWRWSRSAESPVPAAARPWKRSARHGDGGRVASLSRCGTAAGSGVRSCAAAAPAPATAMRFLAPPRARSPPLGGGTLTRRGNGAAEIDRGHGLAAIMHAWRTPATEQVGESHRRLVDRAGAGDGDGALRRRRAVGRAAGSVAPRRAASGSLGVAGRRTGRATKDGKRSERGVAAAPQSGRAAARAGRRPPRVAAAPASAMRRAPPRRQTDRATLVL